MPSPAQLRAARALLGWTQEELHARTGLARRTLWSVENSERPPSRKTVMLLTRTLERAGVHFLTLSDGRRGVTAPVGDPDDY